MKTIAALTLALALATTPALARLARPLTDAEAWAKFHAEYGHVEGAKLYHEDGSTYIQWSPCDAVVVDEDGDLGSASAFDGCVR